MRGCAVHALLSLIVLSVLAGVLVLSGHFPHRRHCGRHTFGDFGLLLHVGVQRLLQGFQHGERFRSVNCFERIIKNLSFVECDSDVYFLFIILSKMAQR